MLASGESQKEVIRPDYNRAIMIDFQGAKITSDRAWLGGAGRSAGGGETGWRRGTVAMEGIV